jgi:hypothetical protein
MAPSAQSRLEVTMEPEPQTKPEILERFRGAYTAFDAALAKASDEQLLVPGASGAWSARDVLTHVAADQRWWAAQLTAAMEGRAPTTAECYANPNPRPSQYDMSTQDGRNAWQYELYRDQPLAEVREALVYYRERVIELANALPDAEFARPYAIVDSGVTGWVRPAEAGEQGFPLWQWFRGNTWHHYEDHLEDIEAAATR